MRMTQPNVFSVLIITLVVQPMAVLAQDADDVSPGYKHDVNIRGISGGAYSLKASVKAKTQNQPMSSAKKKDNKINVYDSAYEKRDKLKDRVLRRLLGLEPPDEVSIGDPMTTALINEFVDQPAPSAKSPPASPSVKADETPSRSMDPEAHHHNQATGGPEDHHHLPTDGSPGAEDITSGAITTFYDNLPLDIVDRLAGMAANDPMATVHAAGDPYAPYASAMSRSDFLGMRRLAQDDNITDLRQKIAMLGLAGATALRSMNNPANKDTFPAKDTLRKVAEDLHYAGQGLDENNPNQAKLKAVCEDISRVWSNMTKPNK